ncbi:hypothetical protein RhiirA5_443326 [Rhizophagus irregularis]|uniref:Uncharacterized protein n=1 Tax=Rhizophagus irregularis TaxID=588596 RepID=A0A2N0NE00_9GLOM|nr:hypothetical protein RhiirA5_443326 [Rhizophagus irregularis]
MICGLSNDYQMTDILPIFYHLTDVWKDFLKFLDKSISVKKFQDVLENQLYT